jgi:hypothetical protein
MNWLSSLFGQKPNIKDVTVSSEITKQPVVAPIKTEQQPVVAPIKTAQQQAVVDPTVKGGGCYTPKRSKKKKGGKGKKRRTRSYKKKVYRQGG